MRQTSTVALYLEAGAGRSGLLHVGGRVRRHKEDCNGRDEGSVCRPGTRPRLPRIGVWCVERRRTSSAPQSPADSHSALLRDPHEACKGWLRCLKQRHTTVRDMECQGRRQARQARLELGEELGAHRSIHTQTNYHPGPTSLLPSATRILPRCVPPTDAAPHVRNGI